VALSGREQVVQRAGVDSSLLARIEDGYGRRAGVRRRRPQSEVGGLPIRPEQKAISRRRPEWRRLGQRVRRKACLGASLQVGDPDVRRLQLASRAREGQPTAVGREGQVGIVADGRDSDALDARTIECPQLARREEPGRVREHAAHRRGEGGVAGRGARHRLHDRQGVTGRSCVPEIEWVGHQGRPTQRQQVACRVLRTEIAVHQPERHATATLTDVDALLVRAGVPDHEQQAVAAREEPRPARCIEHRRPAGR
jgi:hypothetical protein